MINSTSTNDPPGGNPAKEQAVTFPADLAGRSTAVETLPGQKAKQPQAPHYRRWKTWWVAASAAILLAILAIGLVIGIISRVKKEHVLSEKTSEEANAPPRVRVVVATLAGAQTDRMLPGNAQAFLEAAIYGRTNGYLKSRYVDIGDKVEAGQLLGEIATPEIDAQLLQAKATLAQSKATLESNKAAQEFATADELRYRTLRRPGAATEQDYENRLMTMRMDIATTHATEATIQSNQANIQRLTALVSFERLTAPFTGVITLRNVDPGDLITADNPSTERQLFRIAQIDPLRVFVDVPQVYSTAVKPGQDATLFRREEPTRFYKGKVTRTANALNPSTRTLRTEVDVPNPKGALLPGMFLEVKFVMSRETAPVIIPSDAIITRTEEPKVATLDARQAIHYQRVEVGRDFGATVEVLTGLKGGDTVVIHPGDDLAEGTRVQPISRKEGQKNAAGGQQGDEKGAASDSGDSGDKEDGKSASTQDGAQANGRGEAGSGGNRNQKGQDQKEGDAPPRQQGPAVR